MISANHSAKPLLHAKWMWIDKEDMTNLSVPWGEWGDRALQ